LAVLKFSRERRGESAMKSWTIFLIAIGCLFITVSPQLPSSAMYMTVGLVFVLLGAVMLIKKRK